MDIQIAVLEIERDRQAFARDRGKQRGVYVEVDRVAEFVLLRAKCGFDAGVEMMCFVAADR
jgi:hypothetical protein